MSPKCSPAMFLLLLFCFSSAYGYQRLNTNVHPLSYYLVIHPKFNGDYIYHGNLSINLIMNNTDTFSLDCEDLNVTLTTLRFDKQWEVAYDTFHQNNRLTVKSRNVMKDSYEMEFNVSFYGHIRNDLVGFYLSTYEYEGKHRKLGSTQFEASGARKAFPCFDEPSFRANFSLEILVDPSMNAISNMPAISNNIQENTRRIVFAERPSIPSYLIAWVIYENESFGSIWKNVETNCIENNSLNYSIWFNLAYENETQLALSVAPDVVTALENFTGISCEAVKHKMDLVAIPDFQAGAMENWELITFREKAILYNNISSSIVDKQMTIMIIAHELVHQWFGNLVTTHWWSYTWLNEGFARYLQYVISAELYPEMELEEQFLVDCRQAALHADHNLAHPMTNNNITSEDSLSDMFDVITYDKGASVIHMWRSTIGHEMFQKGINNYLNNVLRHGGVSKPEYLFSSLFSDERLGTTWTEQNGYPIVVVTEENSTLLLKQIKMKGWNTTEAGNWFIPINIYVNDTLQSFMIEPNNSLEIAFDKNSSYIINYEQTGFYRVWYNNEKRWFPENATDRVRSMLIDDVLAFSKAGLLSYGVSMDVTSQHLKSMGYLPWATALKAFSSINNILQYTGHEKTWKEMVLKLMDDIMEKVALNDSIPAGHLLKLHKMNLLKHACNYGHTGCLNETHILAKNISYGTPEKRNALLCSVIRNGDDQIWNKIFKEYNTSISPNEKQLFLKALTCTTNTTIIQKLLQLTLSSVIRQHDVTATVDQICETPEGAQGTLNFIEKNHTDIYNYVGLRNFKKIMTSSTKFINDSQISQIKHMKLTLPGLNMNAIIQQLEEKLITKKHSIRMIKNFLLGDDKSEITTSSTTTEISSEENIPGGSSNKINIGIAWLIPLLILFIYETQCDLI